ncbi:hypothetical protein TRFO_35134 [Tritrichomonas foetus]|uniref:Integral membrane protein n=1 Tax=Tritrichomonas foetus TaxID=1144522 RepID=A0A1J4JLN7_9EUKA|nr:hypothetical protein TRFO_35134 [Tritrichomonas foetus]|eukprot:OHS98461.1 hypothetical protein TRFO_35134 [Tritrichomonas foetus]
MRTVENEELELFFNELQTDISPALTTSLEENYFRQVILTLITNFAAHGILLFIMTALNKTLIYSFAIDDFPLIYKVNPLLISMGQFFFSSLFLFPFCAKQFIDRFQISIGGMILTAVPYIATITSSLAIYYFFNPPPYFQLRSFSISCAFFIGFFNKHFYNFPDTIIAVGIMICGTLLSSGPSPEFYFPFLVFGFASSVASVQYPFAIRKSIGFFRRKFVLLAFSLNICSLVLVTPFALTCSDLSIFHRPEFKFWPFFFTLAFSGFISALLCLTSSILIYFSSPLHYIVFSTARSSLMILFQAIIDPVNRVLTPAMFLGHLICLSSGIMVMIFHFQKLKQKTLVPWSFPSSLWRLLGFIE